MVLLDFFLSQKKSTANIAKKRLQVIVAERRRGENEPHYLPQLKVDLLAVIRKHIKIEPEILSVHLEKKEGNISILELNVTLSKRGKNIQYSPLFDKTNSIL
ncbi:cell division topological specificity factor MinE [secondary endosymbiont of Heteropsylla cubana]|uniref:Cell division topological specificity factor n=1 Tax=secondary endosymbiont of Heteropsylla cubana TaxID=134287 RepID=J3YTF3_9ENTR|nr:cell division topological specificity factor MinE [secondary endosymbiont of Heteropsylla cubana]AFP85733.1 cell division topological specificity factor MinE [secondary endosymbiont of Heteropsylla cubana]